MPSVDKAERIKRFQREFDANDTLTKSILPILEKYRDKVTLRGDIAEKDLDLAVSAMFVKAEKTFEAIFGIKGSESFSGLFLEDKVQNSL